MRATLIIIVSLILLAAPVMAGTAKDPLDIQVKKIYSAPDQASALVYDIPVEVRLLDLSEDGNWYKVKIAFKLGPFNYSYTGWSRIPLGDFVAERAKKNEQIARVPSDILPPITE